MALSNRMLTSGGSGSATSRNLFPTAPAPVRQFSPEPVYQAPVRQYSPEPVYQAPVRTNVAKPRVVAPAPATSKSVVANLMQKAVTATPQAQKPLAPSLPTGWGATANSNPVIFNRLQTPTGGGTPDTVGGSVTSPNDMSKNPPSPYGYANASPLGSRVQPMLSPEEEARVQLAAAQRAGEIVAGLTGFGHQAGPSGSQRGLTDRDTARGAQSGPGTNLFNPMYGFAIPTQSGYVTTASAGVDDATGYPYGYVLDPATGEWKPGPEVYDENGQSRGQSFFGDYAPLANGIVDTVNNILTLADNTVTGFSDGSYGGGSGGGGGYGGGGGGGSYGGGGGGGYAGGGSGGSGGGGIGGATDHMDGWAARYGSAGAQEVLSNPAVIAKDTLEELGLAGTGLEALLGQQLTYMASQLLPFVYANTPVGETPNVSDVINMLHDFALQSVQPGGPIVDVGTYLQRLLTKLDPNSVMGATFKGLTPGQQVNTAQGLLNGLSNFTPTPFLGNALRNYWQTNGTDFLSQALRVDNPNTTPFNEFLSGFVYPGGE